MPFRPRHLSIACLAAAFPAAADLPPGFSRTLLSDVPGEFIAFAVLLDLRIIAADRTGPVHLLRPGLPSIHLLTIDGVVTWGEHGVLGVALGPDFATSGHVYICSTAPGPFNIVARYTLSGDAIDPASRTLIWQNSSLCAGGGHQGGGIAFGPDGLLYISTGDQYDTPLLAQSLASQHGKLLRLNADGSIPASNPFASTPGAEPHIWAYGLRNPFRFSIDAGRVYIGDVGATLWEEVNLGAPGANYGWPDMEGPQCLAGSCAGFTAPAFAYSHANPIYCPATFAAIIMGPVYRAAAFPVEYRGSLFYADWVNGWIRRATLDSAGAFTGDHAFDSGAPYVVDLQLGPDGALYYAANGPSAAGPAGIYRIAYTACDANCDGSTTPPILNIQDFACFLNGFAAGDPYANCDGSTTVPVLNVQDFACFLNRFAAGCP